MSDEARPADTGGSTVSGMMAKMQAFQSMSEQERQAYIRKATKAAKKTKLSEGDAAMINAADGYFQDG